MYASAPALVLFNLIFIWAVYILIVRQGDCVSTFSLFHYLFIISGVFDFELLKQDFCRGCMLYPLYSERTDICTGTIVFKSIESHYLVFGFRQLGEIYFMSKIYVES